MIIFKTSRDKQLFIRVFFEEIIQILKILFLSFLWHLEDIIIDAHTQTYTHTDRHTHAHTHTHTHIETHMHTVSHTQSHTHK